MLETLVELYRTLWKSADVPPDLYEFLSQHSESSHAERLAVVLLDQKLRWIADRPIMVEEYLKRLPELLLDANSKLQLVVGEFQARQDSDNEPSMAEYLSRFSEISDRLKSTLFDPAVLSDTVDSSEFLQTRIPGTANRALPENIGRYRIASVLGEGAFGRVYLGIDDELQRHVAIKVPNPERFPVSADAEDFLNEARTVAALRHPNIVPVHDLGRTDDGLIFVVSEFINCETLKELMQRKKIDFQEITHILANVAWALHYAHQMNVIHRDIKPGNILIEQSTGIPFVADFGLAVRGKDFLTDGRVVGTPSYMSPEQARAEGHRLDARTDIFALGIVLYQMLTGVKPFRGQSASEVIHAVVSVEPVPPREVDATIPRELERICLKAISKRVSERHANASEFAEDLLRWNDQPEQTLPDRQIVPRGLRSFEAIDADVFLDLLPGLRNRDGLPESIQFWKTQIAETDSESTFPVGLIYGPSGCGKSSLVKAGLLPRLPRNIRAIYLEATPSDTEARILREIRKCSPEISGIPGLLETLQFLRQNKGTKVVLIIDQFEQWLHSNLANQDSELVAALRQCDGGTVQAIIMVRDDFAMAAARFMDAIDIPIVQGKNFATIDRFDEQHAAIVLARFGQAFGKLPVKKGDFTAEQSSFITSVVAGLAKEGKVVSVQLALFAEMIKSKPWELATLEQVGGTAGIGVNFLEDTFSSRSANPAHQKHLSAARHVLKSLLPEVGSDIKGHMRSQAELTEASGYQQQPSLFNELLRILDIELRLITPTDPDELRLGSANALSQNYQLTHDYLVPALRAWLTRKQAETVRGRMELRLEERTALWTGKREQKQLPSFLEWQGIQRHTQRSSWSRKNSEMMHSATRLYASRIATLMTLFVIAVAGAIYVRHAVNDRARLVRTSNLLENLWQARVEHVPDILLELDEDRPEWIERAREMAEDSQSTPAARIRAMVALVQTDDQYLPSLIERLLECEPNEHAVLRSRLANRKQDVADSMWTRIDGIELTASQTIRAGVVLAEFSPEAAFWNTFSSQLANALVRSDPFAVTPWVDALRPVRFKLIPILKSVCISSDATVGQRSLAASVIAEFSQTDPAFPVAGDVLELALAPDTNVRATLDGVFRKHRDELLPLLRDEIAVRLKHDESESYQRTVNRKAVAVEQAQRLGDEDSFWQHMNDTVDPRIRTVLINDFDQPVCSWDDIQNRLRQEPPRCRQAIVLGLLQRLQLLSELQQRDMKSLLLKLYRTDPDAGVHSAVEFVLRTLGDDAMISGVQKQMADSQATAGNWSVLSNGLCMVSLDRTQQTSISSEELESDGINPKQSVTIDYPFEISATEITVSQYKQFLADFEPAREVTPSDDCPMNRMNLFSAMKFCRWLSEQQPDFDPERCVYPAIEFIGPGLLLAPDYLRWEGFRLPTEHEWEYAARAGSETNRFFGNTHEHLSLYCWWVMTSEERVWPVGLKRPNPWGLFDVHGNVEELCHDSGQSFDSSGALVLGGDYRSTQRYLTAAITGTRAKVEKSYSTTGFRIIRIRDAR